MPMTNPVLAQLLQTIATRHPEQAQLVEAFAPLLQLHAGLAEQWREATLSGGTPFTKESVPVDPERVRELVPLLLDAMQEGFPGIADKIAVLRVCDSLEERDWKRFLDLCAKFSPDAAHLLAVSLKADPEVLHMLLVQLRHALAVRARLSIAPELLESDILHGLCPACASLPDLSMLVGTEGKRVLHCSLCGHRWPYQRTACVACRCESPKNLQLAYLEGHDAEWAESCQACKHYILGVDSRKLTAEPEHAHALALGLLHMDMLMQQEGYAPLEN